MTENKIIKVFKLISGEEVLSQLILDENNIENPDFYHLMLPMKVNKIYRIDDETQETFFEAHLENWYAISDKTSIVPINKQHVISMTNVNSFFEKYYNFITDKIEEDEENSSGEETNNDDSSETEEESTLMEHSLNRQNVKRIH